VISGSSLPRALLHLFLREGQTEKWERRFRKFGTAWLVTVSSLSSTGHLISNSNYLSSVIGVQHHKLAEILLAIFDPRIPKVGGDRNKAIEAMEVRIMRPLLRNNVKIANT
jgi:hypothetical protein